MKIAVASGKGGTGKTMLAVNMALVATRPVRLLDCDVEAPNARLFLPGPSCGVRTVGLRVPVIDVDTCNGCGVCAEFCKFNALVSFNAMPLVFAELCHGCGGCRRVCPRGAISEVEQPIGYIETFDCGDIVLVEGRLNVGASLATEVVRAVKAESGAFSILDAPPGTACPMVETVRGADFVLLVAEETPFGASDLAMAVETVRLLKIPFAVVVNRSVPECDCVRDFCRTAAIDVLAEIPEDRTIAEAYARGARIVEVLPDTRKIFETVLQGALAQGRAG